MPHHVTDPAHLPEAAILAGEDGVVVRANVLAEILLASPPGGLAGRRLDDLIRREDSPGPPAAAAPRTLARRLDGSLRPVLLSAGPVVEDGGTFTLALLRDNHDADLLIRELHLHRTLSRAIVDSPSLEEAAQTTIREAAEALGWHAGDFWVPDESGKALRCAATWRRSENSPFGDWQRRTAAATFARGQGLPGHVWASHRAEWILDLATADERTFLRVAEAQEAGLHGAIAIPLGYADETTAVLALYKTTPAVHDEELARLLRDVAVQLVPLVEQRRAREAELRAGRLSRTIVDTIHEPLAVLDAAFRIISVNQAFDRVLGTASSDVVGRSLFAILDHLLDRPDLREALDEVAAGRDRIDDWDIPPADPPAGSKHLRLSARPVEFGPAGGRLLVVTLEDVSERSRLEEQLRHAQRLDAVGRLAGGVAHDFNNLLVPILGYTGILRNRVAPNDPLRNALDEIHRAAEAAAELTKQLLAFGRKQVLRPRVVDLGAVVAGFLGLIRRTLGEAIEVQFFRTPDLWPVRADVAALQQVLLNLVINARDAMPSGGTLTIETANAVLDEAYAATHAQVVPGPFVMLAITDTGSGMDASTRTRLFEPFFTTKAEGRGSGLGLATCHGIVRQHGGHIWVYSEAERGTTFRVYLPKTTEMAAIEDVPAPEPVPAAGGTETILLVEDDPSVRALILDVLRPMGYDVIEASSPAEAIARATARPKPIHLLLTDVVLPHMNGRELAERIRRTHPEVRVLYISGYTQNVVVKQGFLEPGADLLEKPFSPIRLLGRIRDALDRKR